MTENGTKKLTFLSTLSLRRATNSGAAAPAPGAISIHALLAESDCYSLRHSAQSWYFYPRSPCGERPARTELLEEIKLISIHALLAESDQKSVEIGG